MHSRIAPEAERRTGYAHTTPHTLEAPANGGEKILRTVAAAIGRIRHCYTPCVSWTTSDAALRTTVIHCKMYTR
ncbi:protein of unknown function [Pararobbsia alpina]